MEDEFQSVPEQFSFRPPNSKGSVRFPIQGMKSVIATVTGYHGSERFKLIKLIDHSGANYVGAMSPSTTHVVCWKFEGRKYDLAKRLNMLIVNHRWVEECIKLGRRVPEQPYLFQSGREVGPILLEAPPVVKKVSLLWPHKYNAHDDYKRPAIDNKCGMNGHFLGTHSSMLSENEEPSSPTFMLLARPKRRSTTLAERPRKRRRLVKKSIMECISSDSEEEGNPTNIHHQYNDLTTPYNKMDGLRSKQRLRIRGTSDDMIYDCGGDRNEGLQDVQQLEDLIDTLRDSNLHSGDAPTSMETTSQDQCSNVNENLEGTERLARFPTSTDLSCVICWTDFSTSRGVLPCGHRFCFSCIQSWADVMASRSKISTCPLCKASFVSITKVDDAASSDQKIYSQTIPCDSSRMDIFILPDGETPTLGPQASQTPVCSECGCREPEDLLVRCHLCQIRCIHSYCLDPPLLPWTCIHCKDLRMLYRHIR